MLPAICMDDIKNPEIRKCIIDNMYTTDWKQKEKEVGLVCSKRNLPTTVYENPKNTAVSIVFPLQIGSISRTLKVETKIVEVGRHIYFEQIRVLEAG